MFAPVRDPRTAAFQTLWALARLVIEPRLPGLLAGVGLPGRPDANLIHQIGDEARRRFLLAPELPTEPGAFLALVRDAAGAVVHRRVEDHIAALGVGMQQQFGDGAPLVLVAVTGVIERLRDGRFRHRTDAETAGYLRRRVRRAIADDARAARRHPVLPLDADAGGPGEPADHVGLSPYEEAVRREELDRLGRAIAQLPPTHRRVVEAHLNHPGRTSGGIAALLGTTAQTVRQRYCEARRMLRARLLPTASSSFSR